MTAASLRPELDPEERRRLLELGVEHFNAARFFEAHEAWEEVWRSTRPEPRDLLQGLIQVAVGLLHQLERGRPAVARRVLGKGRRRLEPYPRVALGLDLDALRRDLARWDRWLTHPEGAPPAPPLLTVVAPRELR